MKFSVITVTYNSSETLQDTLSSVADQSLPTIEHIVIDGASKDNTDEVISLHGSHVVNYISEPDFGIYDAMNKGLKLATGEVVCFLNAGDFYIDSGVLERVDKVMNLEDLDIIYGDVAYFRGENKKNIIRRYKSEYFHPRLLVKGFMPAHPAFFMRRDAYQRIEPFRINYKIAGDFEMMIRIFKDNNVRFRYVQEVLVLMRLGGISNKGLKSLIILNLEILRACRENGVKTNILKVLTRYPPKIIDFLENMFRNKFY
jgi:glycosyltransferase involved in cell wall biosynthesis